MIPSPSILMLWREERSEIIGKYGSIGRRSPPFMVTEDINRKWPVTYAILGHARGTYAFIAPG